MRFVPDEDQTKTPAQAPDISSGVPQGIDQRAPEGLTFVPDPEPTGPSATVGGMAVPGPLQAPVNMVTSAAQGFNKHLANLLAVPINDANVIFGQAGKAFLQNGDATGAILDTMDKAGMGTRAKAVYPFLEHVGSEVLSQMLTAAAMMAGAPTLAASTETGVIGGGLKNMGEFALQHPGSVVAGGIGGAVGGPTGEVGLPAAAHVINALNGVQQPSPALDAALAQIGNIVGSTVGGGIGAGTAVFGRPGGVGSPKPGGQLLDEAMGGIPQKPLANPLGDLDPMAVPVANLQRSITDQMDKAFAVVHTPEDTVTAAQKLRGAVRQAATKSRIEIGKLWQTPEAKAAQTQTMDAKALGLKAIPDKITSGIVNPAVENENVPWNIVNAIKKLPAFPELRNVRAIMSAAMRDARRIPKVGETANDTKKKYLNDIVDGLKNSIDAAFPDNQAIKTANTMTKWFHDTFDRSALAPVAQRRVTTEAQLKDAGPLAERLVKSETGGQQLSGLESARPMTGETSVAAPAEQFIRARVTDAYNNPKISPTQAALRLNAPAVQRFIREFPAMDAMSKRFNAILKPAIDAADMIQNNAFLAKVQSSPKEAIGNLFRSADPEAATNTVVQTIGHDRPAMDALQDGVIAKIYDATAMEPEKLAAWIGQARNKAVLETAFKQDPGKLARLNRIIHSGMALASGDQSTTGKAAQFGATIIGKMLGSSAAMMLPGNQLIMAGAGAKLGSSIADRIFSVYTPQQLISSAIKDPRWEALLFSRVPSNLKALRELNARLGQLAGVTRHVVGSLSSGDDQQGQEAQAQ